MVVYDKTHVGIKHRRTSTRGKIIKIYRHAFVRDVKRACLNADRKVTFNLFKNGTNFYGSYLRKRVIYCIH